MTYEFKSEESDLRLARSKTSFTPKQFFLLAISCTALFDVGLCIFYPGARSLDYLTISSLIFMTTFLLGME